jgi:hypothetical protein
MLFLRCLVIGGNSPASLIIGLTIGFSVGFMLLAAALFASLSKFEN